MHTHARLCTSPPPSPHDTFNSFKLAFLRNRVRFPSEPARCNITNGSRSP